MADLDDGGLKDRVANLKTIRDQAKADAERAQVALDSNWAASPDIVETFAHMARKCMRLEGGGYRRGHLRALAQRVEVGDKGDKEVRIREQSWNCCGPWSPYRRSRALRMFAVLY